MKRPLNKEEKSICEKSINRLTKELLDLRENEKMQLLAKEFYLKKCEYEDEIRPYNRKIELANLNGNISLISEKIKENEARIKDLKIQIQSGIEAKEVKHA